jgi:lipopolysaccharide transport system ATP-binding protein
MSDLAIRVEKLGKQYRIGAAQPGYRTFREALIDGVTVPINRIRGLTPTVDDRTIWALLEVSFEVKQGEILGIIGKNGAGKTTLLKILSRITEPTEGCAELYGRVGSLLEVGTGFHPELSGRENIYLNGAILGMKRAEIQHRFDEIVAFAEVEKFIDTPVKHYSSGMYLRLAFAVAAHLEPEILLVDEVLAVGDAAFQKKCLGKMGDVAGEGRTVLFVSHNMQAIRTLCSRSILLDKGEVASDEPTEKTLSLYNQRLRERKIDAETDIHNPSNRRGSGAVRFTAIALEDGSGNHRSNFEMGDTIRFKVSYKIFQEMRGLAIYIALRSGLTGELITSVRHVMSSEMIPAGTTGTAAVELPENYIRPGEYPLYLLISEAAPTKTRFDVLDDLTAPLIITAGNKRQHSDFDPSQPLGYFSLPSRMTLNDICICRGGGLD